VRLARITLTCARIRQSQLSGENPIQPTAPLGIERPQHPQVAEQTQPAPTRIGLLVLARTVFFQGKKVGRLRDHQRVRARRGLALDEVAQHGGQPPWNKRRIHAHERGQRRCPLRRAPAGQQSPTLGLESILTSVSL